MVNTQLKKLYKSIKSNPSVFLKRPYSVFFLPYFVFLFFRQRWNTEEETIYLTETHLNDRILTKYDDDPNFHLKELSDLETIVNLAFKRSKDDGNLDNYDLEMLKRLKRGDRIFALFNNFDLCSYLTVSENVADLIQIGTKLQLPNRCFSIYDVYTFKEFRGKGLYERILSNVLIRMAKKGYTHFWLWVMAHNQVSVKVHEKLRINHVIAKFSEYYRFGFRCFSKEKTDFYLRDLIKE